eukprot:1865501-Rhodomonas_salina.3
MPHAKLNRHLLFHRPHRALLRRFRLVGAVGSDLCRVWSEDVWEGGVLRRAENHHHLLLLRLPHRRLRPRHALSKQGYTEKQNRKGLDHAVTDAQSTL